MKTGGVKRRAQLAIDPGEHPLDEGQGTVEGRRITGHRREPPGHRGIGKFVPQLLADAGGKATFPALPPQGRCRITILEVLDDHGRIEEAERPIVEHGHFSKWMFVPEPLWPVGQRHGPRFVVHAFLPEHDGDFAGVGAAAGEVENSLHRDLLGVRAA